MITEVARAITLKPFDFEVTYTPEDKELLYTSDQTWKQTNRQSGKPTKLFRKLLKKEFKEYPYEQFNNRLRSEAQNYGQFSIVSGADITKYYNESTYFEIAGTLGNSCMRYDECGENNYFEVYEDCAHMLVLFSDKSPDKILGRAILWSIDDKTYMDRVYVCRDYLVNTFIDYAKKNKWYVRANQNLMDDEMEWYTPDDDYNHLIMPELVIHLPKRYKRMPYVDTFAYYYKGDLYNTDVHGSYRLSNTDGLYKDSYDEQICNKCGAMCDPDHPAHYCDVDGGIILCEDCCRYLSGEGIWVPNDTRTEQVNTHGSLSEYTWDYINVALYPSNRERGECSPFRHYFMNINNTIYLYKPEWFNWNENESCYEPNWN